MNASLPSIVTLANAAASINIDPFGGAITAFKLTGSKINPLSFAFTKDQMPANNGDGAPYQGHFACIGRWGEPSAGEKKAGMPNHGEPANISWTINGQNETTVSMQTVAEKEGLLVERTIAIDTNRPVFLVHETVTNINHLGRLYNIVQHPTLAAPFLDSDTIIDCNGTVGFDQSHYKNIATNTLQWPYANNGDNLRKMQTGANAVHSFLINENFEYGWITAYSPSNKLLIGYIWKRTDYAWIHIWKHYNNSIIQYLGIEFGTAGIHQPFEEILNSATNLFGEKTVTYIDSGESVSKKYLAFTLLVGANAGGIMNVEMHNESIVITPINDAVITLKLSNNISYGL